MKKCFSVFLSLLPFFFLIPTLHAFDNNKDNIIVDPATKLKSFLDYSQENILNGNLKGGHDTLTSEGGQLKQRLHKDDPNFLTWINSVMPSLRTGAHDEDTTKKFGIPTSWPPWAIDEPVGPNGWGDFFNHFHNPDTGKGLKNNLMGDSAASRADQYLLEIIRKYICKPGGINRLSSQERQEMTDYFGRILHLIQDMGNPSHTKDDIHIFTNTFENYVRDNWRDIVNSESFKTSVTPENYVIGEYGRFPDTFYSVFYPSKFMNSLANQSKDYYTDGLGEMSKGQLQVNVEKLIPETIMQTAAYINSIYDFLKDAQSIPVNEICDSPPSSPSPSGDSPDDRFDVSDEFYWEKEFRLSVSDLTQLFLRTALKKGKVGVWYKKRFIETFWEGRAISKDASKAEKDTIELKFQELGRKADTRPISDWRGAPDIALFTNGFYNPAVSLMLKIGEPVSFQDIDFNPDIVKDHPVLLVPTGGFYGLRNSPSVKARLEQYVKNGGTLIVFAQRHGYDWALLPTLPNPQTGEVKPVAGYGYQEDQSCIFNSVYIDSYHPILSNYSNSAASIGVDGYFTSYPENATVLLRRTANAQPAMILYPYGRGYVIATASYTDFASSHSQANQDEITFIQNLISWAKKPGQIPETKPGETISVPVEVKNYLDADASSIKFVILDPKRKVISESLVSQPLVPGQAAILSFFFPASSSSSLGIYHVDYSLLDPQGNLIQPQAETDSGRFAVSNPPRNPYKTLDFTFSIQVDEENVGYGSPATFTVLGWNNTDTDEWISAHLSAPHLDTSEAGIREFLIPAKSSASFTVGVPHVTHQGWLIGYFYNRSNKALGYANKGIWMVQPAAKIVVKPNKASYARGGSGTLNITLTNITQAAFNAEIVIKILDESAQDLLPQTKRAISLAPGQIISMASDFTIPGDAPVGHTYRICAEAYYTVFLLDTFSSTFSTAASQIITNPLLPPALEGGNNVIPIKMINSGVLDVSSGHLGISLEDPDGIELFSGIQDFSLAIGQSIIPDLSLDFGSLKYGTYTLNFIQSDEFKNGSPYTVTVSNGVTMDLKFDKPSYRMRENASLIINLRNTGNFNLQGASLILSAPDAEFTGTQTVSLLPNASGQFVFDFTIPETILPGVHNAGVSLILSSGSELVRTATFTVPAADLILEHSGPSTLGVGETISLSLRNNGGVDAEYSSETLSIADAMGVPLFKGEVAGKIRVGETGQQIDIPVPLQAASGSVFLNVQLREQTWGKRVYLNRFFDLNGINASLQTETDKKAYIRGESISELSRVVNGSLAIESAMLKVDVSRINGAGDQFSLFLPHEFWADFRLPMAVAAGKDGSFYVADSYHHRIRKFDAAGRFVLEWGTCGSGDGEFDGPVYDGSCADGRVMGVAVGPDGSVYVADIGNNRVQKFDERGNFIQKWGTYGNGDGQFDSPGSIAVDFQGAVYVTDRNNHRVQKFDENGGFILKWGTYGSGGGQFRDPGGIAAGSENHVFIADRGNSRVQQFSKEGDYLGSWGGPGCGDGEFDQIEGIAVGQDGTVYTTQIGIACPFIQAFDRSGNFQRKWGGWGQEHGELDAPYGIAVSLDGSLLIADTYNDRIQKLDPQGTYLGRWGSWGANESEFGHPTGIAFAGDGSFYVADEFDRIQKFDRHGKFLFQWGISGTSEGEFRTPAALAVGPDGSVYVADSRNLRIQKFDSAGNYVTQWQSDWRGTPNGIAVDAEGTVYATNSWSYGIRKFDGDGNFISKWGYDAKLYRGYSGIAAAPNGSIYLADPNSSYLGEYDREGNYIKDWANEDLPLSGLAAVAAGPDGSIYISSRWYDQRVQKFNPDGTFAAEWGMNGEDFSGIFGIAVSPDNSVYITEYWNHRIQRLATGSLSTKVFETALPVNQAADSSQDYITQIGAIEEDGKYFLQATLTNQLGQKIAEGDSSFYIFAGNMILTFNTGKAFYRPGETVSMAARIENRAEIEASNLAVVVTAQTSGKNISLLETGLFSLPAGGARTFPIETIAGPEGVVTVFARAVQNDSVAAELLDRYEIANPALEISVAAPEIAGRNPFQIEIQVKNTGKIEAVVQFAMQGPELSDQKTLQILPGQSIFLHYDPQITANADFAFTFSGDWRQSIHKTVMYGPAAAIAVNPPAVFAEGRIAVPITIINSGRTEETIQVDYQVSPGGGSFSRSYFLPAGGSAADIVYFDLTEGNYVITARSEFPPAQSAATFAVKKENQVDINVAAGAFMPAGIPVTVNLSDSGWNPVNGTLLYTVRNDRNETLWTSRQEVEQLSPDASQVFNLHVSPAGLAPGSYTMKVDFVSPGGTALAFSASPLNIGGPVFQITSVPAFQTLYPGEEGFFRFRVKNTGDQEGPFEFRFKAYDLIDDTRREVLRPGEEKELLFSFILPEDLEEKDYFADYELKGILRGQVKYHLAGIHLSIQASLDKPYYREGEVARLSLSVSSPSPLPAPLELSARVNYGAYESTRPFTLHEGEQNVLAFDVPLALITGEKLFFGVYHQAGRSIHLNSVYIYKAGDALTIITDKQVYKPGETVSFSVSGSLTGPLTLKAPDFSQTILFNNSANFTFSLPGVMTAGTYFIEYQLESGSSYKGRHPFDVAGIEVKIKEAHLNKAKYAPSDTISLSLKVESNQDSAAILKTWIVDPEKRYIQTGAQAVNLLKSEPILPSIRVPFSSSKVGIHRVVYGIYGPEDLLFCSGSEAFDIGDAVLLGVATDKSDYPGMGEPVNVSVSLFGSVKAHLQLEVDGIVVQAEEVNLNEFATWATVLEGLAPGSHSIKATLAAGGRGLTSTKEIIIGYAMSLVPKPQISASVLAYDFGPLHIGALSGRTLTLSSTGNADLVIEAITWNGGSEGEFSKQNDTCSGANLVPSASCTLDIAISPASLGLRTASLLIRSNAITTPRLNISLEATGIFTLTVATNPVSAGKVNGTGIDCPGDCSENYSQPGAAVDLMATAAEGYRFMNWTGDRVASERNILLNMDGNKSLVANFAADAFTINAGSNSGGTINPSGAVKAFSGGSQTFAMNPRPGYHIADVIVDGQSIGPATAYVFTGVRAGHSIQALFAINQYTISATCGPNGSLSPSGSVKADYGTSLPFTITPQPGYHILDVWVDQQSVGAVDAYTFSNIVANHAIEAVFAPGTYSVDLPRTGQIHRFTRGDDGYVKAGVAWPSPRFTRNPEATLTDNLTGLHWAGKPHAHHFARCDGGPQTWKKALVYIECLNANRYLGNDDWRLPNVNELESLVHAGVEDGSVWLASQGFSGVLPRAYWTSTTLNASGGKAWTVNPGNGHAEYASKTEFHRVWPVRGHTTGQSGTWRTGQIISYASADDGDLRAGVAWPGPRFSEGVNPCVTDRLTGLIWASDAAKSDFLSCAGGEKTWEKAFQYIACLNAGNYLGSSDWRMPNRTELKTLIHFGSGNQAQWLSGNGFAGFDSRFCWSSTTYARSEKNAWALGISDGGLHPIEKHTRLGVLPVRGGTVIPNMPPAPAPTGGGVYEVNTPIVLGGQISDIDGDLIHYEWLDGDILLSHGKISAIDGGTPVRLHDFSASLGLGEHILTLRADDGFNEPADAFITIKVIDTTVPVLTPVPDKSILWPANHKMVKVKIKVNAVDNSGGPVRLSATVTSNEPQNGCGDGDTDRDWTKPVIDHVKGIVTVNLRAERSGRGHGRVYTIMITGKDSSGNISQAKVKILVPHDRR